MQFCYVDGEHYEQIKSKTDDQLTETMYQVFEILNINRNGYIVYSKLVFSSQ